MKKHLFLSLLIFLSCFAVAQNKIKPCTAPEASQFDFWVGEWDLYANDTLAGSIVFPRSWVVVQCRKILTALQQITLAQAGAYTVRLQNHGSKHG